MGINIASHSQVNVMDLYNSNLRMMEMMKMKWMLKKRRKKHRRRTANHQDDLQERGSLERIERSFVREYEEYKNQNS